MKLQLRSPLHHLSLLLVVITCFLATQKYLGQEHKRLNIKNVIGNSVKVVCNNGYRLPALDCPAPLPPIRRDPRNTEPLRNQFAQLPDLATALDKLQWQGGPEVSATQLITLLRALTYSRFNESRFTNAQQDALLSEIGVDYPYLALASTCFYCIDHSNFLRNHLAIIKNSFPELTAASKHLPTFIQLAVDKNWVSKTDADTAAVVIAYLYKAGDTQAAQNIKQRLINQKNYPALTNWISDGLNGGRAFNTHDFPRLPRDMVIAAWEQGAGMAYAPNDLTEYLVSTGHRPALRYVIWLKSNAAPYLTHHAGYGNDSEYLLHQYTNFPVTSGGKLVEYYNQHWAQITWHQDENIWR